MVRVPYDPELGELLSQLPPNAVTTETLDATRKALGDFFSLETITSIKPVTHEERMIPGADGEIIASIFRSKTTVPGSKNRPGVFMIHGGGMVMLNRFFGIKEVAADWIEEHDAVVVSVEYRMAPEHPDPAPVEDCYAGLKWMAANSDYLGFDPKKLIISGASAGGGLAAGVALLARDRGGPALCAQHLQYPMLDDRNITVSSKQVTDGSWFRDTNIWAWRCLLGDKVGGKDVSIYAAPARATDLSGLPTAFVEVGSAEVFRDEDVAYASKLWECGVQAELHVWPGAWHGYDCFFPEAALSKASIAARNGWIRRTLAALQ